MTADSGIIHQKMPQHRPGRLQGLQLWVNLLAHKKNDATMLPRNTQKHDSTDTTP